MPTKRKNIYEGSIIKLYRDEINIKGRKFIRETIVHPGSVVIIPVLNVKAENVILIKQFRYAINKYMLELPAGTLKPDETPFACAGRELEEETGYKAGFLKKISEFYPSPGIMTEKMHLFVASSLIKSKPNPDPDEKIKIVKINLNDAIKMIFNGKIMDGKTISGILMLKSLYGKIFK